MATQNVSNNDASVISTNTIGMTSSNEINLTATNDLDMRSTTGDVFLIAQDGSMVIQGLGAAGSVGIYGETQVVLQTNTGQIILISSPASGVEVNNNTEKANLLVGAGSPNGVITSEVGSIYMNSTGSGVNDRIWVNTDGGTTWTFVVTGA
jgi:hypothetical protein